MHKLIENLTNWVIAPFGRMGTFAFVFGAFSLSVVADLASTFYFLSECNWDLRCEENTFSRIVFSNLGLLGGSMFIFISEAVGIFIVGLPLLCRKKGLAAKIIIRRITIVSLLSLAFYFYVIALENIHFIPYTFLPAGFLFHRVDIDTPLLFVEAGIFLAAGLAAYLLASLIRKALPALSARQMQ